MVSVDSRDGTVDKTPYTALQKSRRINVSSLIPSLSFFYCLLTMVE